MYVQSVLLPSDNVTSKADGINKIQKYYGPTINTEEDICKLLHETTPLGCSNLDNHLIAENMLMIERPDNKLDSKVDIMWHSSDDDELWLHCFSITENKHGFNTTPGGEHLC